MTKKQKAKIDGRVGEAYGYIRILPSPEYGKTCRESMYTVACSRCGSKYTLSYEAIRKREARSVGCKNCYYRPDPVPWVGDDPKPEPEKPKVKQWFHDIRPEFLSMAFDGSGI